MAAGETVGVFLVSTVPQLYSEIPPALSEYAAPGLRLSGGVAKASGSFADPDIPNAMANAWLITISRTCYANCDASTTLPVLQVIDFGCFLNRLAASDMYVNCDCSTSYPFLNVLDFLCYLNEFAAGCTGP
jgi:hypothetical protein